VGHSQGVDDPAGREVVGQAQLMVVEDPKEEENQRKPNRNQAKKVDVFNQ
jgi:hypothetical protein